MHDLTVEVEDPSHPDKYSFTVNPATNANTSSKDLETILFRKAETGKIAFQFTFDKSKDPSVAKRFLHIAQPCCNKGAIENATVEPTKVVASSKHKSEK
jgi:hypothetical protein